MTLQISNARANVRTTTWILRPAYRGVLGLELQAARNLHGSIARVEGRSDKNDPVRSAL
jgi:hypothetical protein